MYLHAYVPPKVMFLCISMHYFNLKNLHSYSDYEDRVSQISLGEVFKRTCCIWIVICLLSDKERTFLTIPLIYTYTYKSIDNIYNFTFFSAVIQPIN